VAKKQAKSASVTVIAPVAEPAVDISPIEQSVNAFEYAAWHFGSAFARGGATAWAPCRPARWGHRSLDPARLHLNGTPKG
jgi:hypothetical protein